MVKLVVGAKGKGKTKYMLENANSEGKTSDGLVIYLDKNSEHMFQLDRSIRLINVKEYPVNGFDSLIGFLCGLAAGNNDIVSIYIDSFLILADIVSAQAAEAFNKMQILSDKLGIDFTISASMDENEIPDSLKEYVKLAL